MTPATSRQTSAGGDVVPTFDPSLHYWSLLVSVPPPAYNVLVALRNLFEFPPC